MTTSAKVSPASSALAPAPVLVRIDTADGQTIRLNRPLTIVGSKGHSHLRILSKTISGSHAVLLNLGNNVFLRDLMSRTHTYVNDRRVKECRLKYGDVLRIGEMRFRFMDADILRQSLSSVRSSPAALLVDRSSAPLVLESPTFVIGRHRGADLQLDQDRVSKVHAVIFEQDGVHFIRDLSRDGTRLNAQPVRVARLIDSAVLEIGGTEFRYQATTTSNPVESISPVLQPDPAPPEHGTEHQETAPVTRAVQEEALAEAAEPAGEQFVFAPEPEILSGPFEPNSPDPLLSVPLDLDANSPHPAAESHSEPELWEFDPGVASEAPSELPADRVDFSTEQVDSADDLENWGITAPAGITDDVVPQPSADEPPIAPAEPIHEELPAQNPTSLATEIESTELPPIRQVDPLEEIAVPAETERPNNQDKTVLPAEAPEAPTPALSEPIDLATLVPPPEPAPSATEPTPPIAEQNEVRIPPPTSTPAVSVRDKAGSPNTESPFSAPIGNADLAPGAPLRDVDEILAGGVLQLGPADDAELPTPQRPRRLRLLWVALALLIVIGACVALWFQFGRQVRGLLLH